MLVFYSSFNVHFPDDWWYWMPSAHFQSEVLVSLLICSCSDIFWTSCLLDIWQIPSTLWPAFPPFIYTAKLKFFILMNTRKGKTVHVAVRKRPNLWVHIVTDLRRGKQLTEWDPALDYKYNVTLLTPPKLQIQWTTDLTTSSVPTIYQEYLCITS